MITIRFGVNNEVSKPAASFATVRQVLSNATLRTQLGFGDNTEARVNGQTVTASYALRSGDIVELITKANSKG